MRPTEAWRSARSFAPAKHLPPSFSVLVVPLDALLLGFSGDLLDLRESFGPRGRVGSGLVGGHRPRDHPRVLESGTKESYCGFAIAVLPEQDFNDLPLFIGGPVDITPASR